MLTDAQATNVLRVLAALDELAAAALTAGSRLDLLYVADTVAADVLTAVGRRDRLCRLLDGAPPSSAREALSRHLARGSV